jgi:hypothetical protein
VRDKKNLVATVTADSHIRLVPINVAGTDGKSVRIADGLNEGERVVLGLPNTLADGSRVTILNAPAPAATPALKPVSATSATAPVK